MSSDAFEELGSHHIPTAYEETSAILRECPSCGALPDIPCTFVGFKGVTFKRHPCWKRYVGKTE